MNRVFKWIVAFFRRQLVGVWTAGMEVPKNKGILRENAELFLKNSAFYSLQEIFSEMPRGATVFWAPETAGKTYILEQMDMRNKSNRRFVYIDFATTDGDVKRAFYRQLGLNADEDFKPLSHYLSKDVFITFIFDHFDKQMPNTMITSIVTDGTKSSLFNILIIVNNRLNAQALLISCGQQREYVRLLGPPYCGRWSVADLGEFADPRYNDLVDQCGTLSPMISIRNRTCSQYDTIMLLRVAKLGVEWEQGERLLGQYRMCGV
jgi:hypothetical protein